MLTACARMIAQAKRPLILTSAGMSADSGIPTFRDREGYWNNFPPFKEKGLEAQDLASPWAFRNVLPHAWAFYEWRRRNANDNQPHAGYRILNQWIKEHFPSAFIHTTNTDGYHLRSGAPADKVKEVHGSIWRLQCLEPCSQEYWDNPTVPLCELDHATMEASGFPTCLHCGATARPHVLMFGDWDYVGNADQDRNFSDFLQGGVDLVILVGSSGGVPTNDYIALQFKERGVPVININLDPAANRIVGTPYLLVMKGLEAFEQLNDAVSGV